MREKPKFTTVDASQGFLPTPPSDGVIDMRERPTIIWGEPTRNPAAERWDDIYNKVATLSLILTFIPCLIASDRIIEDNLLAIIAALVVAYWLVSLSAASGAISAHANTLTDGGE